MSNLRDSKSVTWSTQCLFVLFFSSLEGKSEPKRDFVIPGGLEDDDNDYLFYV